LPPFTLYKTLIVLRRECLWWPLCCTVGISSHLPTR
jgi:hypothetical protein